MTARTSGVRAAAIGDVARLVELMTEFYAESALALPPGPAAAAFEQLLRDDRLGRAWIVESEGREAGYMVLTLGYSMEYGGLRGFVDDFYVRPEFRGRGIGTAALAELRRACLDLGVRALVAEVGGSDGSAQAAYRKSGLADTGNILMALPLASPVHAV